MKDVEKVRIYYANARDFVKQNESREARTCVIGILKIAYADFEEATDPLLRAEKEKFLRRWLAVSRDLYAYGVTDYVKACFGISEKGLWISADPELVLQNHDLSDEFERLFGDSPNEDKLDERKPSEKRGILDYSRMVEEETKLLDLPAEIFARVTPALVELHMRNGKVGTGFIISDKGYLLTNAHLALESDDFVYGGEMSFFGEGKSHPVEVFHLDREKDVALCRFDPVTAGEFSVIRFIDDYSKVKAGSFCMVAGYTNGVKLNPITGNVRDPKTRTGDLSYTVPTNPGDSGGPVLNRKAECIGINKSKVKRYKDRETDQISYATTAFDVLALLERWGVGAEDRTGKGV